jgi:hypothetical protein
MALFSLDYDWAGAVISLDESEVQNLARRSDVAAGLILAGTVSVGGKWIL